MMKPLRPMLERQRYVTQKAHGEHPAGSSCWVSRSAPDGDLVLEFDSGETLTLEGRRWYAQGLEERLFVSIWDVLHDKIAREIDEEVLGELFEVMKAQ